MTFPGLFPGYESNKEVLLEFDDGVTAIMTLNYHALRTPSVPAIKTIPAPYIISGKMKLTVMSVYTHLNNGFTDLAVWSSERKPVA